MSSREKKIYAEITVPGNKSEQSVNTKTTYRGMEEALKTYALLPF